jgi:integrase
LIDQGKDPRQVSADEIAAEQAKRDEQAAVVQAEQQAVSRGQITVGEVWKVYIDARRAKWGERHLFDHEKVIQSKSTKGENGASKTLAGGVLCSMAPLALSALTAERVSEWLEEEIPKRATQAALAFRLLRAFIHWCNEREEYKGIAAPDACARKVSREHLPKAKAKNDALQREQLRLWFDAVRNIPNPTIAVYLQGLLITGARRNELTGLKWEEVDFQWNSITIRDKVEGERTIPLTPYFASLLRDLQRRNETSPTVRRLNTLKERGEEWKPSQWVFSSQTSGTGRLEEPGIAHRKAIAAAGLPPVSLHGLRRSFGSLSEWCEVPVGVVAQIMGHKPSATAEKHYRERPLDLLRMWHTRIEAWILEQAGVELKIVEAGPELKVISA